MEKKNIQLFCGQNPVSLKKETEAWISRFQEKFGTFNISRIHSDNIDKVNIASELLTPPFLSERRLIIIEGFPIAEDQKNEDGTSLSRREEEIAMILDEVPEENVVLFIEQRADKKKSDKKKSDKKSKLLEKIEAIGKVRVFENPTGQSLWKYIRDNLVQIDSDAIQKLITLKLGSIEKIDKEIEKLSLFRANGRVTLEDIESFVSPDVEATVFMLLDDLYAMDSHKAVQRIRTITEDGAIEALLASMLTNMRRFLYINDLMRRGVDLRRLRSLPRISEKQIQSALRNKDRAPLVTALYERIVDLDLRGKRGELPLSHENGLISALEKVILDLKNNKNTLKSKTL